MDAREPEQQATMEMRTNVQRVGSVLISKLNLANNTVKQRRDEDGGESLGNSVGGRKCRNNWPLW